VQSLAKHCNFNTTVGQTHVFQEAPTSLSRATLI